MLEQMSSSVQNKNRTELTKSLAQSPLFLLFCAISRPWGEFKKEAESEDAVAAGLFSLDVMWMTGQTAPAAQQLPHHQVHWHPSPLLPPSPGKWQQTSPICKLSNITTTRQWKNNNIFVEFPVPVMMTRVGQSPGWGFRDFCSNS